MTKAIRYEARIFSIKTRFQEIARLPGGVPREQAIAHAQAHIDEMKPEFAEWLETKLQGTIVAVQRLDADAMSRLDEAYQSCGQLQDIAELIGFELVSSISSNLCEILDTIKGGAAYHKETIECYVSALNLASKPPYSNLHSDQFSEMNDSLWRLVERTKRSLPKPSS